MTVTNPELSKHLRLRIQFGRNPACLNSAGNTEHWKVEVYEVLMGLGALRWPYEVPAELEYISVPDKWDNCTLVPAHRIEIPGCIIEPCLIENFFNACKRARERALVLSGYMLYTEFPRTEKHFPGPKRSSPKVPKLPPWEAFQGSPYYGVRPSRFEREPVIEDDEEPDWATYFPEA